MDKKKNNQQRTTLKPYQKAKDKSKVHGNNAKFTHTQKQQSMESISTTAKKDWTHDLRDLLYQHLHAFYFSWKKCLNFGGTDNIWSAQHIVVSLKACWNSFYKWKGLHVSLNLQSQSSMVMAILPISIFRFPTGILSLQILVTSSNLKNKILNKMFCEWNKCCTLMDWWPV